jgi:tRNA dimethylallyltransferase
MPPVVCIMGPTSSGKTDLSLALAQTFPIEIINVDSAQIYRGMNIGSGKPEKAILDTVPHHLIDILDPKESYSAWQFREDALKRIADIRSRDRLPVLVGGTMMYFKALQQGMSDLPASTAQSREAVLCLANERGWEHVYQRLIDVDPKTASRLAPADKQRISRALEVYELTGIPLSEWISQPCESKPPYDFTNIALIPIETPRSVLHDRIAKRFDSMLEKGLVEETRILLQRGDLDPALPALRSVGYRQVWGYLHNECTFDEMREKAIAATRQLAKRQLTWLRHWGDSIEWDFAKEKPSHQANRIVRRLKSELIF